MADEDETSKVHRKKQSGPKAERKKKRSDTKGSTNTQRNVKAFTFQSVVRAARQFRRKQDVETKRHHVPVVDRTPLEPPPVIVAVVGPPKVGKTTLINSLLKNFTRQHLSDIQGPVTLVSGKKRRLTLIECANDINSMIDVAKVADLVLLLIDASFGFEMEVFEFLNICQVHGFPKIIGVLTHLDLLRNNKSLKKIKKKLKDRFWTEVYQGAKLFNLSGLVHGSYPKVEVHNLGRFISVMRFRPLTWRTSHPYVLADRMEDLTAPEEIRQNSKCDRKVSLYGYVRGTHLKYNTKAHLIGCGDFQLEDISLLRDPCPLPDKEKKRTLSEKEKLLYAPMSGVGGIVYDKDAVYIDLGGSHSARTQQSTNETPNQVDVRPGSELVSSLIDTKHTIDTKMASSQLTLFKDGNPVGVEEITENRVHPMQDIVNDSSGRMRRRAVFGDSEDVEGEGGEENGSSDEEDDDVDSDVIDEESQDDDSDVNNDDIDEDGITCKVTAGQQRADLQRKTMNDYGLQLGDDNSDIDDESNDSAKANLNDLDEMRKHRKRSAKSDKGGNKIVDRTEEAVQSKKKKKDKVNEETEFTKRDQQSQRKEKGKKEELCKSVKCELLSKGKLKHKKWKDQKEGSLRTRTEKDSKGIRSKENREVGTDESDSSEEELDENNYESDDDNVSIEMEGDSNDDSSEIMAMHVDNDNDDDDSDDDNNDDSDDENNDDNDDNDGDDDDDDGNENEESVSKVDAAAEESHLKWKENMFQKASDSFYRRQQLTPNLRRLVYGNASHETLSKKDDDDDTDDEATIGGFFKVKSTRQKTTSDVMHGRDCSLAPVSEKGWDQEELFQTIRDCFVTGKWKEGEDAERLLSQDDQLSDEEIFGDFEDLETGEVHKGEEGSGDEGNQDDDDNKEERDKEEGQARIDKKKKLKASFDAQYDEGDETSFYDELKAQMSEQTQLNQREFEDMDDETRVQYEGFQPGMYVRIELNNMPSEFVTNFDARYPVILGGLLPNEDSMGYMQVRVKKHRWFKRILKTRDPLVVSIGWRRFQSIVMYSMADHNGRYRLLKYTPEHLHCVATMYGPITPPGTGLLAVQGVAGSTPDFRISATGTVLELDKSVELMKKLKLTGAPYKVFKNTAFIKGMFNSALEVAKFEGATIRSVSGLRGQIKRALKSPDGAFRATFEDKLLISDIVFVRTWYPVSVPKYYNPVTSLLLPSEQKAGWQGMKTVGQLRKEQDLKAPVKQDSIYKPIERQTRRFNPLFIPAKLQRDLPFKSKPKDMKKRTRPTLESKRAVVREPQEKKVFTLMQQLYTANKEKIRKRKEKMEIKRKTHRAEQAKIDVKRQQKKREERKKVFRMLAQAEKRKNRS